jgi:4-alpha-methyl-delta7-sterol-4alpha-methyl oxidase
MDLLAAYQDPMFLLFPVAGTAVSMGSFLLWAIPLTWIAWAEPAWALPYRIQDRRPRVERLVWPSVRKWLTNNLILFACVVAAWPLMQDSGVHAGPLPPWYEVAWQLLVFIFVDDFLYYWMHRTLHRGWLFRRIHAVHHRVPTPWAIAAHYMHPVEFVATGALMLLMPLLLGSHLLTVFLWIAWRQWEAAEGHCGYSFPWSPSKLMPLYDGVEYHDFHHSKTWGNYAGFLSYLDGIFGQFSKGYRERLDDKRAGRR